MQLCADAHRIQSLIHVANVFQLNMIKLVADPMMNVRIQTNAYGALVFLLVALIDVELMHNVNRNYIVACALVHLAMLETHISNAHQVKTVAYFSYIITFYYAITFLN